MLRTYLGILCKSIKGSKTLGQHHPHEQNDCLGWSRMVFPLHICNRVASLVAPPGRGGSKRLKLDRWVMFYCFFPSHKYAYIYIYMYIHTKHNLYIIYTYICMYVCMYVCVYVRTYVRTYVCTYVCMYIIIPDGYESKSRHPGKHQFSNFAGKWVFTHWNVLFFSQLLSHPVQRSYSRLLYGYMIWLCHGLSPLTSSFGEVRHFWTKPFQYWNRLFWMIWGYPHYVGNLHVVRLVK